MAKEFFQPVLVCVVPNENEFVFRAINDLPKKGEFELTAFGLNTAGEMRDLGVANVVLGPDAAIDTLTIAKSAVADDEFIGFCWTDGAGGMACDVFAPKPYKMYDLLPSRTKVDVEKTSDGYKISVTAEKLALFVSLEADQPGRFSKNAFTVVPGHPVDLFFDAKSDETVPNFTVRDLHSATYES